MKKGVTFSRISGSGSVCYGLFKSEKNAKKALNKLKIKYPKFWFSYLQSQICREFELLEKNKFKFSRRDWKKDKEKEGGGTSFILSGGENF